MSNKSITNNIERVPELKRFIRAISFRENEESCGYLFFSAMWFYATISISFIMLMGHILEDNVPFSLIIEFASTSVLWYYMIHFIKSYYRCYCKSRKS